MSTKRSIFYLALCILIAVLSSYVLMARNGYFKLSPEDIVAKYSDPSSKFVQVRDITVHYKDEGQGPAILLLHGSFGSLRTWDGVVNQLKNDFRLIRLDHPPSGLSSDVPQSDTDLSLEEFTSLFLDEIGVERASLVGTSSGGIIAYRFAAKHPDRTTALVIANSPSAVVNNANITRPPSLGLMIFLSRTVLKHQPKLYWRLLLESLYGNPSRLTDDIVEQYFDMGRKDMALPFSRSMFARVNDNDETDEILRYIKAPTLLLWGLPDPVLPEETAHQLRSKLSSAPTELVLLRGTGHYPPVESPSLVADQIERFLTPIVAQLP